MSSPGPHAEHGCQMQGSLAYMEASLQFRFMCSLMVLHSIDVARILRRFSTLWLPLD